DGIRQEGDVYRELHDAQVPHIVRLGLAGDVPLLPECGQVRERIRLVSWSVRVDSYAHYRLVLETLGGPLNTFKSTRELCEVTRDATTGTWALLTYGCCRCREIRHCTYQAYKRVQILHRDVSAGNILITEERSGILIDWDLSKRCGKRRHLGRHHLRTGTWQFISIARLQEPSTRPHEVSDDLESF
ncbi:hypothetical protein EDB86DRAFT_2768836, partial [Lactarius hatsudake]